MPLRISAVVIQYRSPGRFSAQWSVAEPSRYASLRASSSSQLPAASAGASIRTPANFSGLTGSGLPGLSALPTSGCIRPISLASKA